MADPKSAPVRDYHRSPRHPLAQRTLTSSFRFPSPHGPRTFRAFGNHSVDDARSSASDRRLRRSHSTREISCEKFRWSLRRLTPRGRTWRSFSRSRQSSDVLFRISAPVLRARVEAKRLRNVPVEKSRVRPSEWNERRRPQVPNAVASCAAVPEDQLAPHPCVARVRCLTEKPKMICARLACAIREHPTFKNARRRLPNSGSNLIGNHCLELAEGFDPFDAFVHPFAPTLARLRANESRAQLFARSCSYAPLEWVGLTRSKMHAIDDMPRKEKREPTQQTPNDRE